MRYMLWLMPFLVLVAGATAADDAAPAADGPEGFVSLFNGKDFSGWRFGDSSALPGEQENDRGEGIYNAVTIGGGGRGPLSRK